VNHHLQSGSVTCHNADTERNSVSQKRIVDDYKLSTREKRRTKNGKIKVK
jgi:hypothetical protein